VMEDQSKTSLPSHHHTNKELHIGEKSKVLTDNAQSLLTVTHLSQLAEVTPRNNNTSLTSPSVLITGAPALPVVMLPGETTLGAPERPITGGSTSQGRIKEKEVPPGLTDKMKDIIVKQETKYAVQRDKVKTSTSLTSQHGTTERQQGTNLASTPHSVTNTKLQIKSPSQTHEYEYKPNRTTPSHTTSTSVGLKLLGITRKPRQQNNELPFDQRSPTTTRLGPNPLHYMATPPGSSEPSPLLSSTPRADRATRTSFSIASAAPSTSRTTTQSFRTATTTPPTHNYSPPAPASSTGTTITNMFNFPPPRLRNTTRIDYAELHKKGERRTKH
jgi:hypothetical protein